MGDTRTWLPTSAVTEKQKLACTKSQASTATLAPCFIPLLFCYLTSSFHSAPPEGEQTLRYLTAVLNAGSRTQYVQCSQPMWGKCDTCDTLNPTIRGLLCPSIDPNADKDEKSHRQNWKDHACCEASPLPWCSHM